MTELNVYQECFLLIFLFKFTIYCDSLFWRVVKKTQKIWKTFAHDNERNVQTHAKIVKKGFYNVAPPMS